MCTCFAYAHLALTVSCFLQVTGLRRCTYSPARRRPSSRRGLTVGSRTVSAWFAFNICMWGMWRGTGKTARRQPMFYLWVWSTFASWPYLFVADVRFLLWTSSWGSLASPLGVGTGISDANCWQQAKLHRVECSRPRKPTLAKEKEPVTLNNLPSNLAGGHLCWVRPWRKKRRGPGRFEHFGSEVPFVGVMFERDRERGPDVQRKGLCATG